MLGLDNPIHIAFLLVLLLLVFGAKRLPEMGKSLGAGLRGFKDSISGEAADDAPHRSYVVQHRCRAATGDRAVATAPRRRAARAGPEHIPAERPVA